MRHVIIGNSAAGLAAAGAIRELDAGAEIILVSDEAGPAYSRCLATYYLAGKIPRDKLFLKSVRDYEQNNFTLISPVTVNRIIPEENIAELSSGEKIFYDRLLIASGAEAVVPVIPGINGGGVFPIRTLADLDAINHRLPGVREAVILGDGLVGITTAQALHKRGIRTSVVGIADYILAQFLDSTAAAILREKMEHAGVNFCLRNSIKEVRLDSSGQARGVLLTDGRELPAQLVVVAAGIKPRTGFLAGSGINCGSGPAQDCGVIVNGCLQTSVPGVFAAGDVARTYDVVRDRVMLNPLWPNAVEQGSIAGANMSGRQKRYHGSCSMNSVNIAGLSLIAAGITNPGEGDYEEFIDPYLSGDNYRKLVFRHDRLVGFILSGNTSKAGILLSLLKEQTPLDAKKPYLMTDYNNYTMLSGLTSTVV